MIKEEADLEWRAMMDYWADVTVNYDVDSPFIVLAHSPEVFSLVQHCQ